MGVSKRKNAVKWLKGQVKSVSGRTQPRPVVRMMSSRLFTRMLAGAILAVWMLGTAACKSSSDSSTNTVATCPTISGVPWLPNVSGVSSANHDGTATVTTTTHIVNGAPIVGYAQAAPAGVETVVTIDMSSDLGAYGSLSLEASVSGQPSGTVVLPLLVSLTDSNNQEFINLPRAGTGGDCAQSGYFTSGGAVNTACTISSARAYRDWDHWAQTQPFFVGLGSGLPTMNTFPTCSWSGGTAGNTNDRQCGFNSVPLFVSGKLASGGNYTARYVLLSGSYPSVSGQTANLTVKAVKKADSAAGGAIDMNVVLVGSNNIRASRVAKGHLNLNTMFEALVNLYNQGSAATKIGRITVFEWSCENGGDAYASLSSSEMKYMLEDGGSMIPGAYQGNAINIFLTDSFSDLPGVVGIAGAIGGPVTTGTRSSGVVIPLFDQIAAYNPSCTGASCPITSQERDFAELAPTIAHEMGHFLGLNHPSESGGTYHDYIRDTPICTTTNASGDISISTCLNSDNNLHAVTGFKCRDVCTSYNSATGTYCPAVQECQFNHLMYYRQKNFTEGTGSADGNMISDQSRAIVNYHPLVQ